MKERKTVETDQNNDEIKSAGTPITKGKKGAFSNVITGFMVLVMLAGIGLLLYPTISEKWNALHQSRIIAGYTEQIQSDDSDHVEKEWDDAVRYNKELLSKNDRYKMSEKEEEEYTGLLNSTGTGIMGFITIPKIEVRLPIYHSTDESVLQIGVGHIPGSSLPVGGESSHTVLSGHRGLPSAKLFTRLDEMTEGDIFALHVLGKVLIYKVCDVTVVLPDEVDNIDIEKGKDYCTLVTCTPYGVNTHRMLVKGEHTETITEEEYVARNYEATGGTSLNAVESDASQGHEIPEYLPIAFAVFAVIVLAFALFAPVKKKKR
ncbi:class C sortase [Oribacterium sp. WCC10]|uniref:class C sortase n=1 Tax=Oribacterium sp. WCC10 TaxID=1855343 RepID=UPI0008EA0E03|nr:class C sortase [Oribacterium sp. WCC10]SFG63232.1 LPXTG-site transpeptidase (sortase) family protein [Oribacterium sp. WCC10]